MLGTAGPICDIAPATDVGRSSGGVKLPQAGACKMAFDTDRIDEAVLALLYLGLHDVSRAWKGFDWDAMNRLHEKGMIENPVSKAKSVVFTADELRRSRELFEAMFTK